MEGQDDDTETVCYGYEETLAALRHRMFPNYAIVRRVLKECKSLVTVGDNDEKMRPQRIVDFGIGCGSASVAALDVFRDSIEWIHGIEPSLPMRDCSQRLIEGIATKDGHPAGVPRITHSNSLTARDPSIGADQGSFDLAIYAYSATDLPDVASNLAAAALLFQKLKPDGIFVMVEPGTPDGFNSIREVREMLLECCPPPENDEPEEIQAIEFEDLDPQDIPAEAGDTEFDDINPEEMDYEELEKLVGSGIPLQIEGYDEKKVDTGPREYCQVIAPCTHNGECPMVRHQRNFVQKHKLGHDLPQDLSGDKEESNDEKESNEAITTKNEKESISHEIVDPGSRTIEMTAMKGMSEEFDGLNTAFCSFAQMIPGFNNARRGEKFSYLVVQKKIAKPDSEVETQADRTDLVTTEETFGEDDDLAKLLAAARHAFAREDGPEVERIFANMRDLESRYKDSTDDELGLQLLRGNTKRQAMGRIIKAPLKKKGHLYIDYCAAPGRIVRARVAKSTEYTAPGLWSAARKGRWGGLWPDTMDEGVYFAKKKKV